MDQNGVDTLHVRKYDQLLNGRVIADISLLLRIFVSPFLGKTAQEWRNEYSEKEGNIRDHATIEQLVVLSNMESINAVLIHQQLPQSDRLVQLNKTAISQMRSLMDNRNLKKLK